MLAVSRSFATGTRNQDVIIAWMYHLTAPKWSLLVYIGTHDLETREELDD